MCLLYSLHILVSRFSSFFSKYVSFKALFLGAGTSTGGVSNEEVVNIVNDTLGERLTMLKNGLKQALEKQKSGPTPFCFIFLLFLNVSLCSFLGHACVRACAFV